MKKLLNRHLSDEKNLICFISKGFSELNFRCANGVLKREKDCDQGFLIPPR